MSGGVWGGLGPPHVALAALVLAGLALLLRSRRQRGERVRAAEEALRASEDRLRWAMEATSEIVWDWDLATDAIYHPSWAQTYGLPEERTPRTGKELGTFMHPEDMPRFDAEMAKAVTGACDSFEVEHRHMTGSGEWKWMNGRGRVVVRDAGGRATRIVGTCTDVTERKRMLARLQIADRMASIGTLAAGVAHEINNPLAYVIGNLGFSAQRIESLLAEPAAAGSGAHARALGTCLQALQEAEVGAERIREIVRHMKTFSRADEEVRAPVQVGSVLHASLALAANEIRHRARVALDLGDVPPVLASESRLSQVFLNLLVNAAQSIPEGHADRNVIRVIARRRGAAAVAVEVRDTGCGIAPENRERLFDPFFTTKAVGTGTGLGLSICHGIVGSLGGEIEVESEVGKGSTFRVILPAADEAAIAAGAQRAETPPPSPRKGPRARILLVDDEPLFCRMVERVLGEEHDLVWLTDAREALRRIRAGERFDALVADLAMPALSGVAFHEEIARVDPELAGRTLFATGGAFTQLATEFVARNPGRVLEKPVADDALRAAIAKVLDRAAPAGRAPVA